MKTFKIFLVLLSRCWRFVPHFIEFTFKFREFWLFRFRLMWTWNSFENRQDNKPKLKRPKRETEMSLKTFKNVTKLKGGQRRNFIALKLKRGFKGRSSFYSSNRRWLSVKYRTYSSHCCSRVEAKKNK
jgi:hypothetical protein